MSKLYHVENNIFFFSEEIMSQLGLNKETKIRMTVETSWAKLFSMERMSMGSSMQNVKYVWRKNI